jgi:hypothetical protein
MDCSPFSEIMPGVTVNLSRAVLPINRPLPTVATEPGGQGGRCQHLGRCRPRPGDRSTAGSALAPVSQLAAGQALGRVRSGNNILGGWVFRPGRQWHRRRPATIRQGILSVEWTAGAITMVRALIAHYQTKNASPAHDEVRRWIEPSAGGTHHAGGHGKAADRHLRKAGFNWKTDNTTNCSSSTKPYLYASKRYLIPFGWYANPIPSTCATAWMIMVANSYNPLCSGDCQTDGFSWTYFGILIRPMAVIPRQSGIDNQMVTSQCR